MLEVIHTRRGLQLSIGFVIGILFGFFLHKGGVTKYDVIIGQLLLYDFTVLKIMLSAVATGMVGVHLLKNLGMVRLHPKPGSLGSSVVGGLIFGVGFGILGYCPGTIAGAVGQGSLDALFGGVVGILIGAGLFSEVFPKLERSVLRRGDFGDITFPGWLKVNPWVIIPPVVIGIIVVLRWIEKIGW